MRFGDGLFFSYFIPFFAMLVSIDPVCHCGPLFGEKGAGCFAFLWFVVCILSVMDCLLFLLMSLVGYVLWLWSILDILYTVFHWVTVCYDLVDLDTCTWRDKIAVYCIFLHKILWTYSCLKPILNGPEAVFKQQNAFSNHIHMLFKYGFWTVDNTVERRNVIYNRPERIL